MIAFRSREFLYQNPVALWALIGVAVFSAVLSLALGDGNGPDAEEGAWWMVAFITAAALLPLAVPMTISVDDTSVHVSFAKILKRTIALKDVAGAEVREYQPINDFGGWGWRKGFGTPGAMAYTTKGRTAVVLTLHDDREVYLGVDDEEGLLAVLAPRIGVAR